MTPIQIPFMYAAFLYLSFVAWIGISAFSNPGPFHKELWFFLAAAFVAILFSFQFWSQQRRRRQLRNPTSPESVAALSLLAELSGPEKNTIIGTYMGVSENRAIHYLMDLKPGITLHQAQDTIWSLINEFPHA